MKKKGLSEVSTLWPPGGQAPFYTAFQIRQVKKYFIRQKIIGHSARPVTRSICSPSGSDRRGNFQGRPRRTPEQQEPHRGLALLKPTDKAIRS
jgi:hypothetical protein